METAEGVDNIEAIASTPGLTAHMVGPFDLLVSLGLEGDWRHQRVQDSLYRMLDAAQAGGLPVIMPVFSADKEECAETFARWTETGVTTFIIGSDKIIVADALSSWSSALSET